MASASFEDDEAGVFRETRDSPPAHYLLKLEKFSLLSENGVEKIVSKNFQAGQHTWKIVLFPKGNSGGKDKYVSIYLMLESTSSLAAGKGINAFFKFFLFDQIRGKYLSISVQGRVIRFDRVKNEWGFAKFIALKDLKEPTKGFLMNDTSLFGVEVFVTEGTSVGECFSVSKNDKISGDYEWVLNQFSKLGKERYSDEFVAGGYKWKLWLHPEGFSSHKGYSLSVFLVLLDFQTSSTVQEVRVDYTLTLEDQLYQNHKQKKGTAWFGESIQSKGWKCFIELKDLKDVKRGFVVDDRCILKANITVGCQTSCKTLNF